MKNLPKSSPRTPSTNCIAQTIGTTAGFCKVQCDAAFIPSQGVGIGIYITNDRNDCVGCGYKFTPSVLDAEIAECLALREGVLLAKQFRANSIILETDYQSAFFKLSTDAVDLSVAGSVIRDIKKLIHIFDQVKYSWTRRIANSVVDQLAKFALQNHVSVVLSSSLPDFILAPHVAVADYS